MPFSGPACLPGVESEVLAHGSLVPGQVLPAALLRYPAAPMSVGLEIDSCAHVLVVRVVGTTTGAEIAESALGLLSNPSYEPSMNVIWDLREMVYEGGIEALVSLAAQVAAGAVTEHSRVALLVATDHDYGVARLYAMRAEPAPVEYRVFRDEPEARAWVGAPSAAAAH